MYDPLGQLGLIVEVPIRRDDAQDRQLPTALAKLVLYRTEDQAQSRPSTITRLASHLWYWLKPDENLYAAPLVPYLSDRKMRDFLTASDLEATSEQIDQQSYLIRCPNHAAVTKILSGCSSEGIVFLVDKDGCSARETLASIDEYRGDYRGYEVPFMSRLSVHGGFFFFAESHGSIEVLGTADFVRTRCLVPLFKSILNSSIADEVGQSDRE